MSKSRITVPREVRRLLGVQPGDHLLFEVSDAEIQVRAARKESPFEKYRGIGNPGLAPGRRAVIQAVRELRGR